MILDLRFESGLHLRFCHGRDRKNIKRLIAGTEYEHLSLEEIVLKTEGGLFNNAAQTYNHVFYFEAFQAHDAQKALPSGKIAELINASFGSFDAFKEAFAKELKDLEDLYRETTGQELAKFYRPPQGIYSPDNLKMAQELGYKTVFWSLAYVDWYTDDQPTAEEAFSKLIPRIHDGAIVLLHSTSRTNAEILDELLTRWEDMGYTFASLDQLPV